VLILHHQVPQLEPVSCQIFGFYSSKNMSGSGRHVGSSGISQLQATTCSYPCSYPLNQDVLGLVKIGLH